MGRGMRIRRVFLRCGTPVLEINNFELRCININNAFKLTVIAQK